MKKNRILIWIISIILICLCITVSICYPHLTFLSGLTIIFLTLINFKVKRKEIFEIQTIIYNFFNSCDSEKYIDDLNKFMSKCLFTKKQKKYFDIYLAAAYIDQGNFNKAELILKDIDTISGTLNKFTQFIYLKTWSDFFFYNRLDEKMKYTMIKMTNIIDSVNNKAMKMQLIKVYQNVSAKHAILTNQNLDMVNTFISSISTKEAPMFQKLSALYLLGLINLRMKDLDNAKIILRKIIDNEKNIFICKDANRLLTSITNL